MRTFLLTAWAAALFALMPSVAVAQAQTVTCESTRGEYRECRADFRGRALMQRQLSQKACVENRDWGYERGKIWVANRCRGVFRDSWNASSGIGGGSTNTIRCESRDGRYRACRTNFRGDAQLVQRLSTAACVEGRDWGSQRDQVWVNHGCRAIFEAANNYPGWDDHRYDTVRCESLNNRYHECRLPAAGTVRLQNQLSDRRCEQHRNWGQSGQSVWVDGGCRADFVVTRDNHVPARPSPYTVTCNSQSGGMTRCPWDARRGTPVLIQRLSQASCDEGYSWGVSGRGPNEIWVSRGCRAKFGAR